ncbi:hypothetical protein P0136_13410 [Lentisphaerota bacterium ZTH]|nr:hypothetical protein JYG24_09075 [Lentisphaerota bacterium]WET06356.1 hypothetical protein P0136_13410 [Lentisphaerota bacterium ZTH]
MKKNRIIFFIILILCSAGLFLSVRFLYLHDLRNQTLQDRLHFLEKKTDDIIIYRVDSSGGFNKKPEVTLKGKDIKDFFACLELSVPFKCKRCKCTGDFKIEFFSEGKLLDFMTYHHKTHIRGLKVPLRTDFYLSNGSQADLKEFFIEKGLIETE